jgi:gliding motility-associated protein GldL
VYELQLQGSSEHLKSANKMYEGIESLYKNLQDSVQDTNRYKEEIGKLATNLGALNTVYGNMLSAMNFNK